MTFAEFVASRRRTETICADIGFDDGEIERGGFIYGGDIGQCYIEDATTGFPSARRGKYYLLIERMDWISDDLAEMEKILWAEHFVYECEPPEFMLSGDDLDAFVQGHCAANNIEVDGDVFGIAFSGQDAYSPREAAGLIDSFASMFELYRREKKVEENAN